MQLCQIYELENEEHMITGCTSDNDIRKNYIVVCGIETDLIYSYIFKDF